MLLGFFKHVNSVVSSFIVVVAVIVVLVIRGTSRLQYKSDTGTCTFRALGCQFKYLSLETLLSWQLQNNNSIIVY